MSNEKPTGKTGLYRQSIDEGYTPVAKTIGAARSAASKALPTPPRGGSGAVTLRVKK